MGKNNFLFPQQMHLEVVKSHLIEMNGADSFTGTIHKDGAWEAEVYRCSSSIFEKASVARVYLCGGSVEGVPTDITLLQAFAWPANPHVPGMIIMASAGSTEGQDAIITFYADLIIQNGAVRQADKEAFIEQLTAACQRHGQDIAEYQSLMVGRGMLGECAAECGMLYFFEQSDAAMLSDIIEAPLKAYAEIISAAAAAPAAEDFAQMKNNRKNIIDWMLTQDYGVKVSRQNNIPMEVIEAYGFPPMSS